MRALTLYQPWATLIAELLKHFETRSWRPQDARIGERIAIHAGKVTDAWAKAAPLITRSLGTEPLPSGAIVALAVLASVHRTPRTGGMPEALRDAPQGADEMEFGDYAPGRWIWQITDIQKLPEPVACPGSRTLWTVPQEIVQLCELQLA